MNGCTSYHFNSFCKQPFFYLNSDQWHLNIIKHEHSWTWEPSQYVFKQILPWLLMWENLWPSLCKTSSTTLCLLCMCVCVWCRMCLCVCVVLCVSLCVFVSLCLFGGVCVCEVPKICPSDWISPSRNQSNQDQPAHTDRSLLMPDTGYRRDTEIQKCRHTVQPAVHKHTHTDLETQTLEHSEKEKNN